MNVNPRRAGVEVVHHACAAGEFDAAAAILYRRVYQGPEAEIVRVRGEYETALAAFADFYPFEDLSAEPRVRSRSARRWILHETASCLHLVGRLREAAEVGSRAVSAALAAGEDHAAAISLQNLAETHLAAGSLPACEDAALQSLELAQRTGEREDALVANTLLGAVMDLSGRTDEADRCYERALAIAINETAVPMLYSLSGVRYATHLHQSENEFGAIRVAEDNLAFCRQQRWVSDIALVLSQVALWSDLPLQALEASDESVRTARTSGSHLVLCEVLVDRAEILLRSESSSDDEEATAALTEALALATSSGYRALEARTRTGLAVTRVRSGDRAGAHAEIELAKRLGDALGLEAQRRVIEAVEAELSHSGK